MPWPVILSSETCCEAHSSVLTSLTSTESSKRWSNQWVQSLHGQSKTAPTCVLSIPLSLCSVCQSGLGNVRGSLSRRTDHKHTHMLSLSCVSRPFSQTKPLRHIGNGTVKPTDFMHTTQIYTSQHCLSVRSVLLNWFSFRAQIFFGGTKIVYCVKYPLNWKPEPHNLLFWFPFRRFKP